ARPSRHTRGGRRSRSRVRHRLRGGPPVSRGRGGMVGRCRREDVHAQESAHGNGGGRLKPAVAAPRRAAGFTLIEVLISITLLALISGICYAAFHLGIRAVAKGE